MKTQDLERLKQANAIWGYEVLAETAAGEVSEVHLVLPTETNRTWYANLMAITYERMQRARTGGLGNLSKGRDGRVSTR